MCHTSEWVVAEEPQDEPKEDEITMLVSSAHLKLASPVLKVMLQAGAFMEGQTLKIEGKVEIELPDDDADVFELLMNAVHNQTKRIPREIDLGSLTKLSIIVDKYRMKECLELVLDMWMPLLRPSLPKTSGPEGPDRMSHVLSWLSLSWVFCFLPELKYLNKIVILESDETLRSHLKDLGPIPDSVIGR